MDERLAPELTDLIYHVTGDPMCWRAFLEECGSVAPQGMQRALYGVILKDKRLPAFTDLIRRSVSSSRNVNADDPNELRLLPPQLRKAVHLHLWMVALQVQCECASAAMDRWNLGVIMLGSQGKVVFINRSAEAILDQKDGLLLQSHGLRAATVNDNIALRRLIAGATRTDPHADLGSQRGGVLAVSRPSGKRPLELLIAPCLNVHWMVPARAVPAVVFVSDLEQTEEIDTELLHRLYGLTRAEAQLASLLVQGKEIREIAKELHVSRNTAKTHLSHLFEKTGAHRQAELLRLLLRGPASLHTRATTALPAHRSNAS